MTLDPTTPLGKLRLRLGDYTDIQQLPDSVYLATIADCTNADGTINMYQATVTCGSYILASLSYGSHQKLQLIEVWGSEAFENMKSYLVMVIKDPAFAQYSPVPYGASGTDLHPILQFADDFSKNYAYGTQSQQLHLTALGGTPQNPMLSYF